MPLPSISVVTPTYNSGKYLEDAVLSVQGQREVSAEHIVQDAGSTDPDTLAVRRSYSHLQWVSEADAGQSDGINRGFRRATGDLVGWLNADDYYLPGALAAICRAAEQHPEADVFYGDCVFVDQEGRIVRSKVEHDFDRQILMYFGCYIPSTSTFFRRRVVEKHLLDCDFRVAMDFEYFARLAAEGCRFHYVRQFIAAFRWHNDNISLKHAERRLRERTMVQLRYGGVHTHRELELLRQWNRAKRLARKLASGNFLRELYIRQKAGQPTRWMGGANVSSRWSGSGSW